MLLGAGIIGVSLLIIHDKNKKKDRKKEESRVFLSPNGSYGIAVNLRLR